MTVPIATLGKPNRNQRVYLKESFQPFPDKVPVEVGVRDGDCEDFPPKPAVGEAFAFRFEGDRLMADVEVSDEIIALMKAGLKPSVSFVMNGEGYVDDKKVITDFDLKYVAVLPEDQSAFFGMD